MSDSESSSGIESLLIELSSVFEPVVTVSEDAVVEMAELQPYNVCSKANKPGLCMMSKPQNISTCFHLLMRSCISFVNSANIVLAWSIVLST